MPKAINNHRVFCGTLLKVSTRIAGGLPIIDRETIMLTIQVMITHLIADTLNLNFLFISSITNTMPERGVLKAAAKPAPAPAIQER